MKTVKGVWTFKDTISKLPGPIYVNFILVNELPDDFIPIPNNACYGMSIKRTGGTELAPTGFILGYIYDTGEGYTLRGVHKFDSDGNSIGWTNENYRTIDFGETEQEVSDEFYAWLVENTVPKNIEINITENGTTTLATAGKYCDRNINVNVEVESEDGIAKLVQGTIKGDYESDEVTNVKPYAFYKCENLSSVSLPNCASIETNAFRECTALKTVNLPNCVSFVDSVTTGYYFDAAANLITINIPNLTTITTGTRNFSGCIKLEEFNAPKLTTINKATTSMFSVCWQLKKVNLPKLSGATISARAFENCGLLKTLILGGNELNQLDNVSAFNGSGIANGTGYVYVPDNLVDTYKTATNWSTFADQIKPISELEG